MSYRVLSRDEAAARRDPEMEISESPRMAASHAESRHLLPSPRNIFAYSATSNFQFPITSHQNDRQFPDWSIEPRSFRRSRRERWRDVFVDGLMVALGLPFFALAGAVIRLDGKVVANHDSYILEQLILGAATLFPLAFSIVVGRASIKLASWKLERGTTLGLLERLMGSRTVGSTIVTQLRLRSYSLVALGLIMLWLLSPLGGQSVLRILSTTIRPVSSFGNITYINTRQPSYSGYAQFYDSWFAGFATLFSASLLAPAQVKNSSMDLWGNVKIPYFSSLPSGSEDPNGWRPVPQGTNGTLYSSLFGIPVSGLPAGNTTFYIESTYMELTCQNITSNITRNSLERNTSFYNPGLISTNGPFNSARNITALTPWAIGYLGPDLTSLLPPEVYSAPKCPDCLPNYLIGETFFPGLLLFQDFEGQQNVTSIYCTPSQAYVESNVVCTQNGLAHNCSVTAQRLSTIQHMSTAVTSLSFNQTFNGMSLLLPRSTQQISHVDLLENYIFNPESDTFIQSAKWPAYDNTTRNKESRFLNLPLSDFGTRLGQLMNAFLYGSIFNSTQFLTGAPFEYVETGAHNASFVPATSGDDILVLIKNLTAAFTVIGNVTTPAEVYVCSYPWVGAFIAATMAMPFAAVLAAILRRKTIARDYLGFVSSLARESQYVHMPQGGMNMDGMQRTRALSNLEIRLGDVGDIAGGVEIGNGVALSVGQLAVGRIETTRSIDKKKLYI